MDWENPLRSIAATVDADVVRSDSVDERDLTWRRQLDELARTVEALSGNPVRLVDATRSELRMGTDGAPHGAGDHRREARVIVGAALPHPVIRTNDGLDHTAPADTVH